MGWKVSPPYQVRGPNGEPTGLAIDLVREAARRRNIALEWVYWSRASEDALRTDSVDLWPFITVTPERLKAFYITPPFMETEHCVFVRSDGPIRAVGDLAGRSIEIANPSAETAMIRQMAPEAHLAVIFSNLQLIPDLCHEKVDAVFMDTYTGVANLLPERDCSGHGLRWIEVPQIKAQLGIGATFKNRDVADELRAEITAISREGKLSAIVGKWGFLSAQSIEPMTALIDSRQREGRLAIALMALTMLFAIGCWQTFRISRERNRTREAEKARRISEQKLRLVANGIDQMVLAFDMQGKLMYANPALTALTGYSIEEIEKSGLVDWFHPEDRERMTALRAELAAGKGFRDCEYRLVTKDGAEKWVSATWTPIHSPDGRQIGIQGSESDVTKRRDAEEALRKSELRFRGLLEQVQVAAAIFDREGNFIFCNDFLVSITGWTREEMLGHAILQFLTPEDADRQAAVLVEWSKTGKPGTWFGEFVFRTKEGKRRWLNANNVTLYGMAGEAVGFASLGVDTTEYRMLLDQYAQSQKLESVGRLAGGIAHDFNNLLTVIKGYSELIGSELRPADPLYGYVSQIAKASQQAETLIRQLLAFSRKHEFDRKPVDVNRMIQASREMFARLLGDDVQIVTQLEPGLPQTLADSDQLTHALLNLAINARDAMPRGGTLTIRTETAAGRQGARVLRVSVADTGTGIPEEMISQIFDPFFTTKAEGKGTGLGLSMVYGTVQQCGGSISVKSELNVGTTFEIELPILETQPEAPAPKPAARRKLPRGTETVLVVEDRESVREFTVRLLEQCGYMVLEAPNSEHALRVSQKYAGAIHVLLSDLLMPGMGGEELARLLAEQRPGIRVILMSGYSGRSGSAIEEDGFEYLAKPFSAEQLAVKIREVLDRGGAAIYLGS
jgi:PAS domain S-box-containing protein